MMKNLQINEQHVSELQSCFAQPGLQVAPVAEITEERFIAQLETLPPEDWQMPGKRMGQSFKSQLLYSGDVTTIFLAWRGRYYEFRDVYSLTHEQILRRVELAVAGGPVPKKGQ